MTTENKSTLTKARALFTAGNMQSALEACLIVIDTSEQDGELAMVLAAEIYEKQNLPNEALSLLSRASKQFPDNLEIKVRLADTYRILLRFDNAIAVYKNILVKDAKHSSAANNLARILIHLGQFKVADKVWQKAIAANGDDPKMLKRAASMFAHFDQKTIAEKFLVHANEQEPEEVITSFMLTSLRSKDVPDRVPEAFIQQHFDNAAKNYDAHLQAIGSAGPAKFGELLNRLEFPVNTSLSILDAGCGTGLCGPILRPFATHLAGVDLSPAMLELARQRNTYDELYCTDLIEFLSATDSQYDLVIAADVLTYFGSLDEVMEQFFRRMKPGGRLIFSVEAAPDNVYASIGYLLSPNGRYKHMKHGVSDALSNAGFSSPEIADPFVLRHEYGEPVNGFAIVTRKPKTIS